MKSAHVKQLLGCTYTTLHNYVKQGKLKLTSSSGKQSDYDDESVYALYDALAGKRKFNNMIAVFCNGKKYEFTLDDITIAQTLDFLNNKIKENLRLSI